MLARASSETHRQTQAIERCMPNPAAAAHKPSSYALMKTFLSNLRPELEQLNAVISEKLRSQVPLVEEIGDHLIAAGGKRLRPVLAIVAARATEKEAPNGRELYSLAAVIEFLHTATLLHDDVIDVSSLRRGRPTANAKWGNAPSVLVGDFLYSRAFQMLVELANEQVMAELADTTNLIAEGEVLQLTRAGQADTTEEAYLQVIHFKTARLFEAAAKCGGILSGASLSEQEALGTYGHCIGMAFQLIDDVLDYSGDPETMGKNVGDDLAEGKPTLPLIHAMQLAAEDEAALINEAITMRSAANIVRITQTVQSTGSLAYTSERAETFAAQARQAIAGLEESAAKRQMLRLTELAVQRNA